MALPSVWKNLFQAGPGSHIRAFVRSPTSVSICAMASNMRAELGRRRCARVMSTPFGKPAWARSSLAFLGSYGKGCTSASKPNARGCTTVATCWPSPPISFWMMACLSIA